MINQPFAGQTVWFVFISVFNYSNTDWENYDGELVFNQTPVGVFSSEKDIFKTMDLESKERKEKDKKRLQEMKGKPGNEKSQEIYQKIVDTEHIWRRVLDFGNQPQIQFWGVDENGNRYESYPIGEPPPWIKSKRVTMEIWEDQHYYNKIYDANDVYCFVEVVL